MERSRTSTRKPLPCCFCQRCMYNSRGAHTGNDDKDDAGELGENQDGVEAAGLLGRQADEGGEHNDGANCHWVQVSPAHVDAPGV